MLTKKTAVVSIAIAGACLASGGAAHAQPPEDDGSVKGPVPSAEGQPQEQGHQHGHAEGQQEGKPAEGQQEAQGHEHGGDKGDRVRLVKLENRNVPAFQRRTLYCPPGMRVLGGGAEARGENAVLVGSFPTDDRRGWIALGRQPGHSTVGISVFAICSR